MNSYILYTDGGARGNPGPAAAAAVIMEHGARNMSASENSRNSADQARFDISSRSGEPKIIKTLKKYLGATTNNVAEYSAVILGLEGALKLGAQEVELRLDSELVGKQLRGEYKVKDQNMQKLFVQAWNLKMKLKKFTVIIIRREQNTEADRLVNEVLDEAERNSK